MNTIISRHISYFEPRPSTSAFASLDAFMVGYQLPIGDKSQLSIHEHFSTPNLDITTSLSPIPSDSDQPLPPVAMNIAVDIIPDATVPLSVSLASPPVLNTNHPTHDSHKAGATGIQEDGGNKAGDAEDIEDVANDIQDDDRCQSLQEHKHQHSELEKLIVKHQK